MQLLFPWFAVAGVAAAVAVAAVHLIVLRERAPEPLPTTRFVPLAAERAPVIERRPRDLLLLLLRASALALAGLGLARPSFEPILREPRTVVAADTGAGGPWSLSAALVAALRTADSLGARGHPVEITIVSPFLESSLDSATLPIRLLWPGRMTLARVHTRPPSGAPARVDWPRVPRGDTVAALVTDGGVIIAPFVRGGMIEEPDNGFVLARWVDGAPAATETALDTGCVRRLNVGVPDVGDLLVRRDFLQFLAVVNAPCGVRWSGTPLNEETLARLRGSGPRYVIAGSSLASSAVAPRGVTMGLLLLGTALLIVELRLRRRPRT